MKIFNESIPPENFPGNGKIVKVTPVFNQKSAIKTLDSHFCDDTFRKF